MDFKVYKFIYLAETKNFTIIECAQMPTDLLDILTLGKWSFKQDELGFLYVVELRDCTRAGKLKYRKRICSTQLQMS